MANVLDRHAETVWAELGDDRERRIAERFFKALTDTTSDRRGVHRPSSCPRPDAARADRTGGDVATAMRFLDESAAAGEAARARRREEMRQEQELEKERAVGIGQRARIEAQERAAKVQRRVTRVVVTALVVSTPLLFGLIGSWMAKHSREQVFNEREEVFRTREDSFESSRHPSEEAPGT